MCGNMEPKPNNANKKSICERICPIMFIIGFYMVSYILVITSLNSIGSISSTIDTISLQCFSILVGIVIGIISIFVGTFGVLYNSLLHMVSDTNIDGENIQKYINSLHKCRDELKDDVLYLMILLAIVLLVVWFRNATLFNINWPVSNPYFSKDVFLTTTGVWAVGMGLYTMWDIVSGTFNLYEAYTLLMNYVLKNKKKDNNN
jgi:amino acid transporter